MTFFGTMTANCVTGAVLEYKRLRLLAYLAAPWLARWMHYLGL